MMIFWFVIIGVLVYVLLGDNVNFNSFQKKNPVDLLDERLAKGDLSIEEYHELKRALKEER